MLSPTTLNQNLQRTLSKGQVALSQPASCRDLALYLFDPQVLQGPISHDEAQAIVAAPAYWSFCWASGQVLAQAILDNPEWVAGRVVADVGSGSGIVAIAAALAGAKTVYACDIDPDALHAIVVNAQHNKAQVKAIKTLDKVEQKLDLITAADLLYDRDNFSLLEQFSTRATTVLLADSRVRTLPAKGYQHLFTKEARTWPDLNEFEEFNQVRIYRGGQQLQSSC